MKDCEYCDLPGQDVIVLLSFFWTTCFSQFFLLNSAHFGVSFNKPTSFMLSVKKCIEKKITKQKKQPAAIWYTVNLNAANKTHSVYCSVSHSSGAALSDCEKRCLDLLQNLSLPACRLKRCTKALKQFERTESSPSWECCLHCGRGLCPS